MRAAVSGNNADGQKTAVDAVLEGQTFQKSPTLRTLLKYLWDHRDEEVSEYAIAVEAFSRPATFDPKTDATVRVQMSRLRQKLRDFYEREGRGLPHRLVIPTGTHRLQIDEADPDSGQIEDEYRARVIKLRRAVMVAVAAAVVLGLIAVVFAVRLRTETARASTTAGPETLPPFWSALLGNGRPTKIVIPTPVFFAWEGSPLKARDPQINDYQQYAQSPEIAGLSRRLGPPNLAQNYTATTDTLAAIRLIEYLSRRAVGVSVITTPEFSTEQKEEINFILLGNAGMSEPFHDLLARTNFEPVFQGDAVRNQHPRPGEQTVYRQVPESPKRRTVPGLVAILPASRTGNRVLAMISVETIGLAACVTTTSCLNEIEAKLKIEHSPATFEAVIESQVDSGRVLQTKPVALRAFP